MAEPGIFTFDEIISQPQAWQEALDVLQGQQKILAASWKEGGFDRVLCTGCGSTYYLALAAAALLQELSGLPVRALPASELWLNPGSSYPKDGRTLLLAFSRSGETSETLHACREFGEHARGTVITLTCEAGTALTSAGDLNLVFPSGSERSVAQTRAFTTLYLAAIGLAGIWFAPDLFASLAGLPQAGGRLLANFAPLAQQVGRDTALDRFYFLGSGGRYGLACELSLKMKEMSLSHSEPFHFLEFRHGPKSMAGMGALVLGLVSQRNRAHEQAVLDEMAAMGARTLALGEEGCDVNFASGLHPAARNVLYLPFGQLMAFERAMRKGLDPDRPANLEAVVRLEQG